MLVCGEWVDGELLLHAVAELLPDLLELEADLFELEGDVLGAVLGAGAREARLSGRLTDVVAHS